MGCSPRELLAVIGVLTTKIIKLCILELAVAAHAFAVQKLVRGTNDVSPEELRAFARRDWGRIERAKRAYWKREHARRGVCASLEAASALADHVRRFAPQDEGEARALDYAHHVRLKRRIDVASSRLRF